MSVEIIKKLYGMFFENTLKKINIKSQNPLFYW
jgi:hypothetical protein